MDSKVLTAQQWVNATYGNVPGYTRCPEDGQTGWSTMYSLTRALQVELGITALSNNFGPTTLSKLAALGDIGPGFAKTNIVRIVQHALFCKGYWGGQQNGDYDMDTSLAVGQLKDNAGIQDGNSRVQPKILKALLTMDAYVVLAGGTDTLRSIQQWLNGRYFGRRDFYLIPCDGIFSRDVQRALYLAIQFELGMTDDQATGVFGPGTQSGLKAHALAQGASGIWVQLFSAACVANGKARYRSGSGYGYREAAFTSSYDADLTSFVRAFQEFSELPVNGNADYTTWCQALISTGDVTRPGSALDCITTITDARAQALLAAGYHTIGRYLDERPSANPLNKAIQPGELDTIFRNGMRVFPISQYDGTDLEYFTYSQGYQDGLGAHAAAVKYGFGTGTVIYFAVDYDATGEEIASNIGPYFKGVVGALANQGKKYIHGVYGSRNVCIEVTKQTYARWSFVSGMSAGFSGNMGFPLPENWAFNQVQTLTVGSGAGVLEIDKNIHKTGTDPGVATVNVASTPVDAFVAYIGSLYDLARAYGGQRDPNQLVLEFLRHEDYTNYQWEQLIGDVDWDFINHVKSTGVQMIRELRDPFYGIDLKVSHLAATANGVYVTGKPSGTATNRGDVAGWGGDWMTFYGEWRRDSDSYASGLTYCQQKLAKVDGDGTFKLRDLIEDADGHHLAMRLRSGATIADEVTSLYQGSGYLGRFRRYFDDRFGNATGAKAIAKEMLMPGGDLVVNMGRSYLIETTGGVPTLMPHLMPNDKIDEFCQGFADMLLDRVGQEDAQAMRLRLDGKS